MTTHDHFHSLNLSRRGLLRGATLFAAGGALLGTTMTAGAVLAANKLKQTTVNYQDKPRGKAQCDNCSQWQSPAACKLVDGSISPTGWCSVYAPKS
jgi:hypothetical protein